eukprot:9028332-Lingulodinium_polyedra.AAC.1
MYVFTPIKLKRICARRRGRQCEQWRLHEPPKLMPSMQYASSCACIRLCYQGYPMQAGAGNEM